MYPERREEVLWRRDRSRLMGQGVRALLELGCHFPSLLEHRIAWSGAAASCTCADLQIMVRSIGDALAERQTVRGQSSTVLTS